MYIGRDFNFPADSTESYILGIDFVNDLPQGDSISGSTISCAVAPDSPENDASAPSRLTAGPFVNGTVVSGRFAGLQNNVKYILTFTVTTTQGNTLVDYTHMFGEMDY